MIVAIDTRTGKTVFRHSVDAILPHETEVNRITAARRGRKISTGVQHRRILNAARQRSRELGRS